MGEWVPGEAGGARGVPACQQWRALLYRTPAVVLKVQFRSTSVSGDMGNVHSQVNPDLLHQNPGSPPPCLQPRLLSQAPRGANATQVWEPPLQHLKGSVRRILTLLRAKAKGLFSNPQLCPR